MNPKSILIPIKGDQLDEKAIALAGSLAKKGKAKIYAVYVIEVQRSLPVDAVVDAETETSERVLSHAEDVAAALGYDIEVQLLQAREAGTAIVEEAVEKKVDMIIMGVSYKTHFGVFDLGEAVSHVLRDAPCPVILYREAP
ncbi:MAG: universal stress protein, partial [Chloroflexota bacterium]